ncbi:MAG: hypothetical protein ACRDTJ_26640, partial [Pseudonocardiaceae bacterium]
MAASSPDYSEYRDTEPREDALLRLARLAHAQREAEEAVEKAQAALQAAQDQLREISQQQIPALMDSVEMKTYTTKDGVSIS